MTERNFRRGLGFWILVAVVCVGWLFSGGKQLLAQSDQTYEGLKLFSEVIEIIEKNYVDEVKTEDLIEGAIQGMVHSLDPHSSLLPPDAYKELQIDTRGEFGGLGVVITIQDGMVTVVSPIEGTPAARAGLAAGDRILEVDGESTKDMTLFEAVKMMRGPKGTDVVLTVYSEGTDKPRKVSITRDIIPLQSVRHIMVRPGYGYVRVTNFRDTTTDDVRKALADLEKKADGNLEGLILDLRNNPGGLLSQSVSVADIFLDEGDIVSIKGRRPHHTEVYSARTDSDTPEYPLVVLIDAGTASAAEIVAGALKDHKRAVVMGTTSFGKGSVQTVEALRDGYGLKLTIARYYTPDGTAIQVNGITPDVEVLRVISNGDEEDEDTGPLTEKDLENHLEPEEPQETKEPEYGEDVVEDEYGKLTASRLLKDNQIRQALDFLVGYNVLAKAR